MATKQVRILSTNTKVDNTGNTNENIIYTGTIPANSIGVDGSFHIIGLFSYTNSGNNKTFRIKFNGTQIGMVLTTTSVHVKGYWNIWNRHSLTAQVSFASGSSTGATFSGGTSSSGVNTYTINTGADITFTVTAQCADAGDTASIEALEVIANY